MEYSANRTGLQMVSHSARKCRGYAAITRMSRKEHSMFSNKYCKSHGVGSIALALMALGITATLGGCQSDAQTGALFGSGIGAGIGAIIGHNVSDHGAEGALIGAGIGALGGYAVGNESDKQRAWRSTNYDY
jgi:hypothetical protein